MKHMAYGKAALLGVFVLAGCYSYASEAINNGSYNTVQASPNFVVIKVGDSDRVILRLINDANNGAITSYKISGVGAGIRVDSSCTVPNLTTAQQVAASCNGYYRPIFVGDTLSPTGDKTAQQFFVLGLSPGQFTFTATPTSVNTSVSKTVTVVVAPITLGPSVFSKTSGLAAGDTLTLTAPTNTVFSQTSAVTFTVGPNPAVVFRSADSTQIKLLVAPGDSGAATVTKVGLSPNPAVPSQTLTTSNGISIVPAITVAPTTVSTTTPLLGAQMTVTLGGNLRFTPTSTITIGGTAAIILSRSADSSTATIVPEIANGAASAGLVSYTNIVLSFLNSVPLSVPGDKNVNVNTAVTPDPNAGTIATASTIVLAPSGGSIFVGDAGPFTNSAPCAVAFSGDGCRWYKVVLAASTTIDIDARWQGGSDNGLYVLNSTGTAIVTSADAGGQGSSGQPETKTATLPAGTYFFGQVFFGANSGYPPDANTVAPTYYLFRIVTH